jgi:hypothetical protein
MKITISDAVSAIDSVTNFAIQDNKILAWDISEPPTGNPQPEQLVLDAKIAELELAEPMRVLRQQRNTLLSQTDWQATSDRTMTNDQQIYRQELRDLPENSTPELDENGQLTGVTWPDKPE